MEYFDFFKPNKYGVILRERLFVNDQNNFVSIKFKLGRVLNPPPKEDLKTMTTTRAGGKQGAPPGTTARAGAQGGATTRQGGVGATARGGPVGGQIARGPPKYVYKQIPRQDVVKIQEKYLVTLEFYKEKELIKCVGGHNEAELLNITLKGSKESHSNFYLQVRFDLREVPPQVCRAENMMTTGLCWTLLVSSSSVSLGLNSC